MRWFRYDWADGTSSYMSLTDRQATVLVDIPKNNGKEVNISDVFKLTEVNEIPLEYKSIRDVNGNGNIMDEDLVVTKKIREQISSGKTEFEITIATFYMKYRIEILPFEILLYSLDVADDTKQKSKYVTFDKDSLCWCTIYCDKYNCQVKESIKEIGKAMISYDYQGLFDRNQFVCVNGTEIKNDNDVFILRENSVDYIWQLGSKVADMEGVIVPNLYKVRKIGMIV